MNAPHEPQLFEELREPLAARTVARVAIERGIDKLLDYAVPKSLASSLAVGQRVRVPLGRNNKPAFGFVAEIASTSSHDKLKSILAIADERPLANEKLLRLALWISRYYFTPLGMVLETMIPSAVKKRIGGRTIRLVKSLVDAATLQSTLEKTKARKRRAILARLLQLEPDQPIELHRLAEESGVKPPAIVSLRKLGLIDLVDQQEFDVFPDDGPALEFETPPPLTGEQKTVVDSILPVLGDGFSVHLIRGVTGSGKTEVYLRLIDAVVKAGRGAVVLVPEIALTPQTVRRFTRRFEHVAVMHSGLAAGERHRQWSAIASGRANVVIGARSAVFAPHPSLGLIVVDEEHEGGYKQDSAPRYHGRDVAIKRAQLESIPVVLGSATPSLEMWHRVTTSESKTYRLHTLAHRVAERPLPEVEIVDMKRANRGRPGIQLLSPRLEQLLRFTIDRKQQAILLLNRRGYSNFIYCASCQEAVQCRFCDKTLTYHRAVSLEPDAHTTAALSHVGAAHCHYCLAVNPLPTRCEQCGKKLSLFGLGTQRVEEELERKFADVRFRRVDSDSMRSARDYESTLAAFARGEIDVLLGTQMLAKGLDFPNVTLVGVINGDTALSLPDFRAAERTFQLITQVAGRAGRGTLPGRVIVQTFLPDDPTLALAIEHDFLSFASRELEQRQSVSLPPFSRQARIVLRDESIDDLARRAEELAGEIDAAIARLNANVELRGPMPCAVGRIAGYYRHQILLSSPTPGEIQNVLSSMRRGQKMISDDRLAIDVDPTSLL